MTSHNTARTRSETHQETGLPHLWKPPASRGACMAHMVQRRQASGVTGDRLLAHLHHRPPDHQVQCKAQSRRLGPTQVHTVAASGIEGSGSPLPHLETIQHAFGKHDITSIQAHVGGPATSANTRMGAEGYAMGNHVAFKDSPSLHLAAHEAAHVVQQRGGVRLKGGVGQIGDAYEQHADAVADAVVRGQSAETLLDQSQPNTETDRAQTTAGGGRVQLSEEDSGVDIDTIVGFVVEWVLPLLHPSPLGPMLAILKALGFDVSSMAVGLRLNASETAVATGLDLVLAVDSNGQFSGDVFPYAE
ncbi:MAG: DUF4157 domain-containing protein, partial [Myxococcota bacterium]